MKIQLTKSESNIIDGFKTIVYTDPSKINDINTIINNSCEYILANTILDDFEISESQNIVNMLVSKLRIGGSIVILGHDIQMLAKMLISNDIGVGDISDLIKDKKSINTALNIILLLESNGLTVVSFTYNKFLYEITAKREVS